MSGSNSHGQRVHEVIPILDGGSAAFGAYSTVAPVAQTSTASVVVLAGCEFDARTWKSLAYTFVAAAQTVTWTVWGANAATYADEVQLQTAIPAVGTPSSYAVAPPPYAYYRVKIVNGDGAGSATVRGIVKR
jgi:hypothetical protein